MKIRSTYAVGAALALVLGLAACGDSDEDTTEPTTQSEETEADEPEEDADADEADSDAAEEDAAEEQATDEAEAAEAAEDAGTSTGLTEEGGLLVDTNPDADVLDGSGVAVTVDPSAQTVLFELIDPASGEVFQDNFEFDYANGEFRHHKFVAAIGAEFNYVMDLESNEILSIIGADGEDGLAAVEAQGRLEGAQADRDFEREELETYFEDAYGMTVEEAATN